MPGSVSMFCHWSAQFAVEYVPPEQPSEPGRLIFTPLLVQGKAVHKEWFATWHRQSLGGKPLPELLNALLPLSTYSAKALGSEPFIGDVLKSAEQLGPLFTALPWHGLANNSSYEEPVTSWYMAAQHLADLGAELGRLSLTSKDSSSTARKRRAIRAAEAVYGEEILNDASEELRRQLIAPYLDPPGIAPIHDLEVRIGLIMDHLWIIPLANTSESDWRLALPRLRLSPADHTLQLNLPFGLQALLVMMGHDQRLGRSVLLRTCERPDCRVVKFMQLRQKYCSSACQNADAVRRHRQKAERKFASVRQID